MTDKEKLDAIRAEIHRLVDVRGYDRGMANDLFAFMDSLPNEPVSKDLEEAAMKNVVLETKVMKDSDGDGIDTPYEEWLTLEDTEIPFIPDNIGLKDGDKVKIIIIKQ